MNEYFNILNQFKGFGEPNGSIWFIGIEEAGQWSVDFESEADRFEEFSKGHFCWTCEGNNSKIYESISKIVVGLNDPKERESWQWRAFRDKKLFQEGVGVFQANLYPLGKSSVNSWPDHYKDVFGFGREDKSKYIHLVRSERFPALQAFWKKSKTQATICFGKTYWEDFKSLLNLEELEAETYKDFPFQVFPREKVILTPFFGNAHMSDSYLLGVQEILLEWGAKVHYT